MRTSHRSCAFAAFAACGLLFTVPAHAQDARTLIARAMAESNQERQVQLLCQAADLEPGNKQYRNDCNTSKAAMIASDKQALKTAQDAIEAGQTSKARRYAKYVSTFDPDLHKQAEQLLAKLDSTGVGPVNNAEAQKTLLAQAESSYQSGNLQAARTALQGVTEPALKSSATQMLNDIDKYTSLVSTGAHHEQAKEFADAERSYQAALTINPHVASDDLAGKVLRVRNLAAASAITQTGAAVAGKNNTKVPPPTDTKNQKQVVEASPDDKKKRLLDEGSSAMSRNDLDTAGKKFKQVLDLDPGNTDAKNGLSQITVALNKDPARMEKTLREAIVAFYSSHFEDAESQFNRYLGADGGKKKGAAYFYLGATEATLALLDDASKRALRTRQAREDFKQAREAGYRPIDDYVSARILGIWKSSGM